MHTTVFKLDLAQFLHQSDNEEMDKKIFFYPHCCRELTLCQEVLTLLDNELRQGIPPTLISHVSDIAAIEKVLLLNVFSLG